MALQRTLPVQGPERKLNPLKLVFHTFSPKSTRHKIQNSLPEMPLFDISRRVFCNTYSGRSVSTFSLNFNKFKYSLHRFHWRRWACGTCQSWTSSRSLFLGASSRGWYWRRRRRRPPAPRRRSRRPGHNRRPGRNRQRSRRRSRRGGVA